MGEPIGRILHDLPKVVRYRPMEPEAFEPNDEVDEVRWVPLEEAVSQLTYDRDRDVLASA